VRKPRLLNECTPGQRLGLLLRSGPITTDLRTLYKEDHPIPISLGLAIFLTLLCVMLGLATCWMLK
jgi:hypothetical protein